MKGVRLWSIMICLFVVMSLANAQSFGTNLIVNPGGDEIDEFGTTAVSTSFYYWITDTLTMFGWTVSGNPLDNNAPTTYRYDSTPGSEDYPLLSEGPFDDQGNYTGRLNFFFGGFNWDSAGVATASQDIDLSGFMSDIDSGGIGYDLSGWLGGYYGQADSATISAIFYDGSGAELSRGSFGPLTPEERSFSRNLFYMLTGGTVLPGTRWVRISMEFTGGGWSLDGYVDNLSFSLRRMGDVNGDGCIDDADLLAVLFAFGGTCTGCPEDVNGDGIIDDSDLLTVLFGFGSGC